MELISFTAIVLSIIALVRVADVTSRVKALENKNKGMSTSPSLQNIPHQQSQVQGQLKPHTQSVAMHVSHEAPTLHEKQPEPASVHKNIPQVYEEPAFIKWLKEDWLLKLGGVLVIMGVLFFLSLAYTNVDPAGKVMIGYLFGISLMVFGFRYAKKQIVGGSTIHVIGAITIIITSYLGYQPEYNVFDAYSSMMLMFLTTVCVALTAFAHKRIELAQVGLVMAGMVPVLTNTVERNFFGILVYLAVVIIGVLWLAFVTRWRALILTSLVIMMTYSAMYITGGIRAEVLFGKEILMIVGFGALFFITSLFSILRTQGETGKIDGIVALLNAGYALMWIMGEATPELAPIIIATTGLLYALGFFCVYKVTNVYTSFLVYGGVTLGMLTTSIMLEVSGRALTVILLLMGALVTVFTYYLSKDERITKIMAFFNILPIIYILSTIADIEERAFRQIGVTALVSTWKDFLILGLAIVVYFSLYKYFVSRVKSLSTLSLTIVILLIVDVVWQVLHLITTDRFATQLSFLIIGMGLTLFIHYFISRKEVTEKVALINILTFIGVLVSIGSISNSMYRSGYAIYIWKDWVSVGLTMILAFFFYYFFLTKSKALAYAGLASGLFLVMTSIWQILQLTIGGGLATFISIFIYTIIGLYTLWSGSQSDNQIKVKLSRLWLGLIAGRVILYDAWQAADGNIVIGVLICIVIGVLLISSTFIIKKVTETTN